MLDVFPLLIGVGLSKEIRKESRKETTILNNICMFYVGVGRRVRLWENK